MLNNDGEQVKPNITDVKLLTIYSKSFWSVPLTHKNPQKSSSAFRMFKNADSMSLRIVHL